MTAAIVTHTTRERIYSDSAKRESMTRAIGVRPWIICPPGQLWERLAEYAHRNASECQESRDGAHRAYVHPVTGYRYCQDCEVSL